MKLRIYLIIFTFFIITAKSQDNKGSTLMWEISDPESNGKVFVLGSIHMADERIYPLHKSVENAFENADVLVLEIIIDNVNPFEIMQFLTFKDERTLESELPEDVYKKVAEMFEKNNIPKSVFNKFKPWFAIMTLQSEAVKGTGVSAGEGIDMYFLKKARETEKKVMEIESLQEQIKLLEELGEFTGDYMRTMLDDFDEAENTMDKLLEAYKNADIKVLEELSSKGSETEEFAPIMEKLNFKRNENMSKSIEEYLTEDKVYFVVVGAAHVIGERGIINILQNQNKYKIKRY